MGYDLMIIQAVPTPDLIDRLNFKLVPEGDTGVGIYVERDEIDKVFISESLYESSPNNWDMVKHLVTVDDDKFDQMYEDGLIKGSWSPGMSSNTLIAGGIALAVVAAVLAAPKRNKKSKRRK